MKQMKFLQPIGAILRGWTDSVAAAVIAAFDRVSSPRVIRLIEQDDGGFAVESAGKSENMPQALHLPMEAFRRPIWRRCSGEAGSRSSFSRNVSCFARWSCLQGRRISSTASCARRSTG